MATAYRTYINGEWLDTGRSLEVHNKFSGAVFATVATVDAAQTAAAIDAAAAAFATFRKYPAHRRAQILERTAELILERGEEIAAIICQEAGKAWKFSMNEVQRSAETFKFAAEEAKRLHGETIPVDASCFGENRVGYFIKEPIGVIGAITPFNFPLNLVAHKVAPAIAAGNTVVLKPASSTPISSIILAEIMALAGLPKGVLNVTVGSGGTVGDAIVLNPKCKKITFTGSPGVGEQIMKKAGIKKVTLELGNNSATLIEADADLEKAAARCVVSAFSNSGQVCISLQRIYVNRACLERFTELFLAKVKQLKVGDPLDRDCDVGPMIDAGELARIDGWVKEAVAQGAVLACGGQADGMVYPPTVLTNVTEEMKVMCLETFAPVVSIVPYDDFTTALECVNSSDFGLQAGVYTNDINKALQAVDDLDVGGVMINDTATFRVDHLPYGGNKLSGLGREGVRFALEDMTNIKMVMINRN
ncbi:aldehyde dehydrogenase family protein [Pelobacter seleniigenes]|uniref:aldehyde dehydrogenase family protein n=1 Tax=Pelobacter seleniigenes TaxID=407188 RepID=UPI0004A7422E|nr:aldehyde dehydrogenase family protein [Pelobacter seleniigenes]